MVKSLGVFAQAIATHLIALAILWGLLVAASYAMVQWCFKKELSWVKAAQVITGVMAVVFSCVAVLYFLPDSMTISITKVVVPCLVSAAALHGLLLAIDRYMRHKYSEGIIPTRLVVAIITIYTFFIVGALILLKINNLWLIEIADISVNYLTRGAIVGLLLLEVFGGRCKDQSDETDSSSSSYSKRW